MVQRPSFLQNEVEVKFIYCTEMILNETVCSFVFGAYSHPSCSPAANFLMWYLFCLSIWSATEPHLPISWPVRKGLLLISVKYPVYRRWMRCHRRYTFHAPRLASKHADSRVALSPPIHTPDPFDGHQTSAQHTQGIHDDDHHHQC